MRKDDSDGDVRGAPPPAPPPGSSSYLTAWTSWRRYSRSSPSSAPASVSTAYPLTSPVRNATFRPRSLSASVTPTGLRRLHIPRSSAACTASLPTDQSTHRRNFVRARLSSTSAKRNRHRRSRSARERCCPGRDTIRSRRARCVPSGRSPGSTTPRRRSRDMIRYLSRYGSSGPAPPGDGSGSTHRTRGYRYDRAPPSPGGNSAGRRAPTPLPPGTPASRWNSIRSPAETDPDDPPAADGRWS
mmetsp:Transcript_18072/g.42118  ORF Transcript_18072/g.42118 Transcript_18072/m.42118 type:complete len:243 (-) Transcript_18072:1125-1853(-)